MEKLKDQYLFHLDVLLKQTRPGYKNPDVILKAYPIDRRTCAMTVLKECLKQTHDLRANTRQLFISYIKPYKAVSTSTIFHPGLKWYWRELVLTLSNLVLIL